MASIVIEKASKSFGEIKAVSDVSLEITDDCLFGLIGPDGSGKTTLFRLITTLLECDRGNISVFGYDTVRDYKKIRQFTGYMPGRFSLYPDLTVAENLQFYATIFGTTIRQNYKLIEPVYALLEPFRKRLARDLSGGMKQKLALSCALIHNPKVLVLDEPTTGVDAVSRKEFWENLRLLKNTGMAILVSTPYMDEAAKCDRIALMQTGVILEYDDPKKILERYSRSLFEVRSARRFELLHALRKTMEVKSAYLFGESIHVTMRTAEADPETFAGRLSAMGFADASSRAICADMEDCFIDAVDRNERN